MIKGTRRGARRAWTARGSSLVALAGAVLASSCTERVVFRTIEGDDTPVDGAVARDCDDARAAGESAACDFAESLGCLVTNDDGCCQRFLLCADGVLKATAPTCAPGCDCATHDCPAAPVCPNGASCTCPPGQAPLGPCPPCTCVTQSECATAGNDCPVGEECYYGTSCTDPTDLTCTSTCSAPGCATSSPVGCAIACEPASTCSTCVAVDCECVSGDWKCASACAVQSLACAAN